MNTRTRKIVAGTAAVAAVPVVAVGAELALHPPCELKSGCRATANTIGYQAVKSQLVFESFSIYTNRSETDLYNTTRTDIGQTALTKLISYYENSFARPMRSHAALPLRPSHRPTDVPYTARLRQTTDHKILVVSSGTAMPYDLPNNGVTASEGTIPQYETVTVVRDASKEGYSALDVLGTEVCQAVVDVAADRSDLARQLSQETFCNSEGDAIQLARHGLSYSAYRQYETHYGGGQVPYEGQVYDLRPTIVSSATYAGMQQTFGA